MVNARRVAQRTPNRVAMISMHTSPLAQPGTGDAGGMNVYIDSVARRLAVLGIEVDVFTRATSARQPAMEQVVPGYQVHNLAAGPFEGLNKEELPGHLCAFSAELMRHEAYRPPRWFDVVHSHYWLSGQVGWVAAQRWDVPLVHSMHTLARVKNDFLADGDRPEPATRILGEDQIVNAAARLIANTEVEAAQHVRYYDADPEVVDVVHPGVDLEQFRPGDKSGAREMLDVPADATVLLFVGRLQPLKAPDLAIRALAQLRATQPAVASNVLLVVCGGPSGTGLEHPDGLLRLAADLGVLDLVRFEPPADRDRLASWYQAADLTLVPSYNESFGLVAVESQASGTPVVAANVGGLPTAVGADSGVLIDGHDPADWARVLEELIAAPRRRALLAGAARSHAESFSWSAAAAGLLRSYRRAAVAHHRPEFTAAMA